MRKSLHRITLELLHNRPVHLTYNQIASDTDLGKDWIKSFSKGTTNPSVNFVQTLYEYLSGRKLDV